MPTGEVLKDTWIQQVGNVLSDGRAHHYYLSDVACQGHGELLVIIRALI